MSKMSGFSDPFSSYVFYFHKKPFVTAETLLSADNGFNEIFDRRLDALMKLLDVYISTNAGTYNPTKQNLHQNNVTSQKQTVNETTYFTMYFSHNKPSLGCSFPNVVDVTFLCASQKFSNIINISSN